MIIVFKLIGAFAGLRIAVFFGASPFAGLIIGGILGHSLDIVVSTKINQAKAKRFWKAKANEQYGKLFMGTVFTMLGKLCTVDGPVHPKELEAVEDLITNKLKLRRKERREALDIFKNARKVNTSFQFDAAQFYELHQSDAASLENFVGILFTIAAADGKVSDAEERLIHNAAMVFNLQEDRYRSFLEHFTGRKARATANGSSNGNGNGNGNGHAPSSPFESNDPYVVLGCARTDTVAVIKQNYRKLVTEYHPDKIVSKNLPEDFTRFASDRFKSIQAAYEAVRAEKGF